MEKQLERRNFAFEIRATKKDDGKTTVRGHAAVFNQLSENLGGFREQIDPAAFDDVLKDDVRALINHDPNLILARTISGTLRITTDETGLAYEYDEPDTTYSRDLLISMNRGDVTQSSFGFSVLDDSWGEDKDGNIIRTIKKIGRLYDVSPVTYPAYPQTDVAKRSMDEFRKNSENKNNYELQLKSLEQKLKLKK